MKTVGELREFIKDLPDDTPIVKEEYGMEKSGYISEFYPKVKKMKKVQKYTYDRFDGTDYRYDAYVPDENGSDCLAL